MTAMIGTGIAALEELADILSQSSRSMIICGARPQPEALLQEAGFDRHIGADNICLNINDALKRAGEKQQEKADALGHPSRPSSDNIAGHQPGADFPALVPIR
jgi:hypothetical protein